LNGAAGPPAPVLIAAGGTGGHLFPARALAEELARRGVAAELVTDRRAQIFGGDFPARRVHLIPAATPVGASPLRMARALATLGRGVIAARRLIRRIGPSIVVGFGGYPTVPPVIAARLCGVTSLIHEQNAVMGRANRLLAHFASAVALSVPRPALIAHAVLARSVITGNPVRDAVVEAAGTAYRAPDGSAFRLLVFGGSQGAHVFSEIVPAALARIAPAERGRIRLVQQCRSEDVERLRAALAEARVDAEIAPFFADLPARIAEAHLVIARSGASTVSEIAAIGRPAILVPLPHAIDNDQRENARALAQAGGGWMIEERALDADRLAREIGALMGAPERLTEAAGAAKAAGRPDAAGALCDLVAHLAAGGGPSGFDAGRQKPGGA
jgi:UDP-N-acetylglucosamine--N-acetylmuramyl-(pentapeptide) pyrophosphoryl-undecaprenol N-acetylglucosamine transferase